MVQEYQALMNNHTWELVPLTAEKHVVSNKWVFRVKYKVDGSLDKYKARVVAKGFQRNACVDFFETFSSVTKPFTIKIVFTLVVTYGWDIKQIDVNNAFLNGKLQETVYMLQPPGFEDKTKPNHVCKPKKALYGLKQVPRAWFEKLKATLVQWGVFQTVS